MPRVISIFKRLTQYTYVHKIKTIVGCAVILSGLLYGAVFFIAKSVQFSYAGNTCARQLTFFPDLHSGIENEHFTSDFHDKKLIGKVAVASLSTCFTAVSEPKPGVVSVQTAPFGGVLARKNFSIVVPNTPVANLEGLEKPLPATRPVSLELSEPDRVNKYRIEYGTTSAGCVEDDSQLECDVPALKLKQGKKYTVKLTRQFNTDNKTVLGEKTIKTLKALEIQKISVKNKQTIYTKPKSFTIRTDKPVVDAKVLLTTVGNKPKEVPIKVNTKGKQLTVQLSKHLEREKQYTLKIKHAEAKDGSTLIEPKKVLFTTSGGPKVVGVDIGVSGVSSSAVATITFDQPLSNQDISKYVSMKGGSSIITKQDRTVTVSLQNLPRCQTFTLRVAEGLQSKHGIKSNSPWAYNSRTLCHSIITYGTSVQGRPLQAFVFGNSGSTTMYVGAIHGNEPSSSGLMKAWVNELEAHPDRLKGKRIVVVPTVNPDGVAAGTRTNSRGVNLNRNFPTDNWEQNIDDTDGTHKNGGGKKPLSEPEAKALATLTQQYGPTLMLSFHAIGSVVAGDPGEISATYASKYGSMVGYRDATGSSSDVFEYSITGSYEQWAYDKLGIPNIVIELGSYDYYSFDHHRSALWAMVQ